MEPLKNYRYHGESGWIKQPNRVVKTFPSGLCMIQQDYIRRKNIVDYNSFRLGDKLPNKDSAPCIDGAYIFPEPDYQDMGNGFIKCTVVAYGRVGIEGSESTTLINGRVIVGLIKLPNPTTLTLIDENNVERTRLTANQDIAAGVSQNGFFEALTRKYVITQGESLVNNASFEFKIFNSQGNQVRYPITQELGPGSSSVFTYEPSIYSSGEAINNLQETYNLIGEAKITPVLQRYDSVDYGRFKEITATYFPRVDVISKKANLVFHG